MLSRLDRRETPRNFWLDACRSLAIIMVLASHGRHFLIPAWKDAAIFRLGGFLGVELFFVLSGFLIGNIVWSSFKQAGTGHKWVLSFMIRRWLRTLPTYYLFLFINALLIGGAVSGGHVADLLPFVLFTQNLAWPHPVVFGEAWSLSVEEIFYLILPISLVLFGHIFSSKKAAFLSVVALLLLLPLVARTIAVGISEPSWDAGIRKVVVFRLDALMIGVLTSWLLYERPPLTRIMRVSFLLLSLSIVTGAVTFFLLNEATLNTDVFARVWLFPLVSVGCVLLVVAGLTWHSAPAIIGRPAAICARWSYALYLAHMPVFNIILWSHGNAQPENTFGALVRWGVFIGGSVCAAALVERFVERPTLRWRDRIAPR
ncbi:Peptidoglycan/LPS O-acetylase OafA/YrhL, contains acyltransferase and SGNH-hydrolase domains [Polaromonas sp. YR568]|uniref:acyltransferase family protein n=1 Tax=Polaromonas sp. YR568 TaxID=1855301 RepID=UPI0008E91A9E|nr:acyltransferase [Polaromonas sp. YR568]SFV01850.1 Peptidoglycan/LPS O-acetylase OafA/YrhL, contains acyltransferase and SGNH-hydrolase domains [Polaromonas sp. YR568]